MDYFINLIIIIMLFKLKNTKIFNNFITYNKNLKLRSSYEIFTLGMIYAEVLCFIITIICYICKYLNI